MSDLIFRKFFDAVALNVGKEYDGYKKLSNWLNANRPEMVEIHSQEMIEDALSDKKLGKIRAERLRNIRKVKFMTTPLNWLGWIFVLVLIFYPRYYEYLILIGVTIPLVSIFLAIKYSHIINGLHPLKPSVSSAFNMPIFGLGTRAMADYYMNH